LHAGQPGFALLIDNGYLFQIMREFTWSGSEKKAARAAFDLALARELKATRQEAVALLQSSGDDRVIWRLHDYLSDKRREIDAKYDYRYSVLMLVFPRLVSEGWLKADELAGIGAEKLEVTEKLMSLVQSSEAITNEPG
jgi:Photoprotection regulator fluorescence recovery protein